MSRRRVRPEELELWQQVARGTDPLHKDRRSFAPKQAEPARSERPEPSPKPAPIPEFELGGNAMRRTETHVFPRTTSDHVNGAPVQMDRKTFTRLKRGKLRPEARIDLHGMTLDQAHPALIRFIMDSQSRGRRLVLVITGKGSREDPYDASPRRRGVLKSQVPHWLRLPPVGRSVLQVSEAHRAHGGTGAYYVYLRRS
ncbi:Smr/MutS family protein [Pseudoponticoccus marisrubri]|uniref:DNA mismatch repair protein MutS n=1 Tax=Pseudoponticoccus marisrubri TaxID=1685382 RepID=A0A0W7WGH6_9RHOB|nr:Smr/MutS family protein [Pseudoponticoccus marisrubri]KUF09582.1 DNA mismatch repair protein MutS [Pseudoponticoccus marisrubri]